MRKAYQGYQGLNGSAWGFYAETGTHALRLMLSGLFDRHPGVATWCTGSRTRRRH